MFRTTARWLHDSVQAESLFEKPYLDSDYRAMHLNMPTPDWPQMPERDDGMFPDEPSKLWTFKFDPGICTLGVASLGCGEEGTLGVSIGLLPPGSAVKSMIWKATSSDPDIVKIVGVTQGLSGTIHLEAAGSGSGTATICATGSLIGEIREELTVPFSGGGVLDYRVAASIPALSSKIVSGVGYDCGCTDITVSCSCEGAVWDDVNSAETVAKNASCAVFIIEPSQFFKTWTISGTGFWFNSGYTVTSVYTTDNTITVYADNNACGIATVTACGVTGYVRCTTGSWVGAGNTCGEPGTWDTKSGCGLAWPSYCCSYERVATKYKHQQRVCTIAAVPYPEDSCLTPILCEDILGAGWANEGEWHCCLTAGAGCDEPGGETFLGNSALIQYVWEC